MTSMQITEWKAYYYLTSGEYEKNRQRDAEELKAEWRNMFSGRIVKKEK